MMNTHLRLVVVCDHPLHLATIVSEITLLTRHQDTGHWETREEAWTQDARLVMINNLL